LGSLLATIDPKMFTFVLTFNVLMIVVTGGLGSITGSVLAGIAITILLEWLRFVENPFTSASGAAGHSGHAHGGVLAGADLHHPLPPRGLHGQTGVQLGLGRRTILQKGGPSWDLKRFWKPKASPCVSAAHGR